MCASKKVEIRSVSYGLPAFLASIFQRIFYQLPLQLSNPLTETYGTSRCCGIRSANQNYCRKMFAGKLGTERPRRSLTRNHRGGRAIDTIFYETERRTAAVHGPDPRKL